LLSRSALRFHISGDDKSFLFLKNIPKFRQTIENYNYEYLTPYNIIYQPQIIEQGLSIEKGIIEKETLRQIEEEPEGIIINSFLQKFGNRITLTN
jgi:hypothetical protein